MPILASQTAFLEPEKHFYHIEPTKSTNFDKILKKPRRELYSRRGLLFGSNVPDGGDAPGDLLCHVGVVHGVQVDAVHAAGDQVGDLVDGVGDAGLTQGVGVVAVPGQDAGELAGDTGPAGGHHAQDGAFGQYRHDARLDGRVDARDAGPLQEAEEVVVVKEELADQVLGSGVHFFLQMADVVDGIRAFRVALRVAGGGDAKVPPLLDVGYQFTGVPEVGFRGIVRVHVSPQGQDVLHSRLFQLRQQTVRVLFPGSHASQVGHGGDVVLVLDEGGDLPGALVDLGTSRPECDADEVGTDVLQAVQGLIDAVHRGGLLWGEHLAGENGAALAE